MLLRGVISVEVNGHKPQVVFGVNGASEDCLAKIAIGISNALIEHYAHAALDESTPSSGRNQA